MRILKAFDELSAEPAQLPQENMILVFCLTGEGEKVWVKARVESTKGTVLFDRDCLDWPLDPSQTVPHQEPYFFDRPMDCLDVQPASRYLDT